MTDSRLNKIGRAALSVVDSIADRALTLPKRRQRPTRAGDIIGPRAITDLVGGSIAPSILMIGCALAVIAVLWFIAKIGLWIFLAAVWAVMIAIVYKLRKQIVLGRVREAIKRREDEWDARDGGDPS